MASLPSLHGYGLRTRHLRGIGAPTQPSHVTSGVGAMQQYLRTEAPFGALSCQTETHLSGGSHTAVGRPTHLASNGANFSQRLTLSEAGKTGGDRAPRQACPQGTRT